MSEEEGIEDGIEMPGTFRARLEAALSRPVMLDPRAVSMVRAAGFRARADAGSAAPPFQRATGGVGVVCIDGPLAQRAWSCWMFEGDGYDAIQSRVQSALDDPSVSAIVLKIDSPGGEVAGCFESVRAIRAAATAANKPMVAYADETCASAAYALACACDEIVLPDTGCVGSVGVIAQVCDESAAMALEGVAVHLITSGARKADGHSSVPLTTEARAAIQSEVDHLANVFFAEVSSSRGMAPDAVRSLEAGVYLGESAVSIGLADAVGNLSTAIARAAELATSKQSAARATGRKAMEAKIKAALGLPDDATEESVMSTITTMITQAGKASALESERKAAEGRERDTLVKMGRESGKIDASYLANVVPTMSLDTLRAHVENAKPSVPVGAPVHQEAGKGSAASRTMTVDGKVWDDLSAAQKHALFQSDPALAKVLKAEFDARKASKI